MIFIAIRCGVAYPRPLLETRDEQDGLARQRSNRSRVPSQRTVAGPVSLLLSSRGGVSLYYCLI